MNVTAIWRYPVKSMMGEELNSAILTEHGIYGDRAYGVVDASTGKLANAKNPNKWPSMFQYKASFIKPVHQSKPIPPVRITLPDGSNIESSHEQVHDLLSKSFQHLVQLHTPSSNAIQFEGYIPENIEELQDKGTVFTRTSPTNTFFDIAMVHLITTSTIDTLRELSPSSRIEPRRFRPNLIINTAGQDGFVEQNWIGKTVTIGNSTLRIIQPTKRCIMTTLAQGDLPKDPNVLRTLVQENDGNFGVYAEVLSGGEVKTGDQLIINS